MAESPESPSRYSLPPEEMEEKPPRGKKLTTRKRKAPPSQKNETTQAEPGKIKIDFLIKCYIFRLTRFFFIIL